MQVVKKVGANEQQPAAAALGSNGHGPRASPAGAVDHLVKAMLFIGVYGHNGPKAVLIHVPAGKSSDDSDTELAGGVDGNMTHVAVVVSKRNIATMLKTQGEYHEVQRPRRDRERFVLQMLTCSWAQTFA